MKGKMENKIVIINNTEFRIYVAQDTHMSSPLFQYWIAKKLVTRKKFNTELRAILKPVIHALNCVFY